MWEESREANFLCGECRDNERIREVNDECRNNEHSCIQVQTHRKRFTIKKRNGGGSCARKDYIGM